MSIELPDWIRGTLLLGRDGAGNIIPILVDAAGQINVLLRGEDALGTVRTVRVDNVGQLYAILRGAGGNDVSVDAAGNLAAILKGIDGLGNLRTLLVDAAGQAIMVPRGSSGNYLDVDASGYLTAVLKGLYGGALNTIAVDANGRIEAFGMDAEDQWGKTLSTGNSETAARLGSLRTWDWRGQTVYLCDFRHGIPASTIQLSGAGSALALTPEYSMTSGYSVKLTGGSNLNRYAGLWFKLATNPSTRWGLEVMFSTTPTVESFGIRLALDWGATRKTFGVRAFTSGNQLQYWNNAGAWTNFQVVAFTNEADAFKRMKFVADFTTGKYVRCLYDPYAIDMSALSGQASALVGLDYMLVEVLLYSRNTFNDVGYLDSFVVTVNEPI